MTSACRLPAGFPAAYRAQQATVPAAHDLVADDLFRQQKNRVRPIAPNDSSQRVKPESGIISSPLKTAAPMSAPAARQSAASRETPRKSEKSAGRVH